jgi:hypothetical protein
MELTNREKPVTQKIYHASIIIIALAGTAIGIYMWVDPLGWYGATPGVINTGSYNHHFVRDIGAVYMTIGLGLLIGLRITRFLQPALMFSACWLFLHAIVHLWDVAASRLPIEHLMMDFPGVFLPPIIFGYLAWWAQNTTS